MYKKFKELGGSWEDIAGGIVLLIGLLALVPISWMLYSVM